MDEAKIGEILAPVSPARNRRKEQSVQRHFWRTLRRAAGHIPFAEEVVASFYCAFDPNTPSRARGILIAALAYFIMPFDFIPDFLFGFGFTDDVSVLIAAITAVRVHITPEHRSAARRALEREGYMHPEESN